MTYVYVAEKDRIARYTWNAASTTGEGRQQIISGLPDASLPELGGSYGHELKNIALDGNRLFVSIASTCNVCVSDTQSNPVRGSIYLYNADGTGGRLFARGIRNAEGLAVVPGTADLWVVINNRDNIAYPFHNDWNNDGSDDYGKVMPSYVDNHPPDEFTRVRESIYISDDHSGTVYRLAYVSSPPPPSTVSVAQFSYTCSGFDCNFDGTASTNATSHSWNFGDGGTAAEAVTSHPFAPRRNYTVTLTTLPSGGQSTASRTVRCNPKKCT